VDAVTTRRAPTPGARRAAAWTRDLRGVRVHGSFGPYLERLLAKHFASLACVWGDPSDATALRRFDPDRNTDPVVERNVGRVARGRGLAEDE
jgi:hypothetical protein